MFKNIQRTNRKKELDIIFSKCPKKIFKTGLELGAGDGFQSTIITKFVMRVTKIRKLWNIRTNKISILSLIFIIFQV